MGEAQTICDRVCVEQFRALRGRAHRPAAVPTRRRPAAETEALLALVPHFGFGPLTRLLELAGLDSGVDLVELRAVGLADALLERLRGASEVEAREILAALTAAHAGLVARSSPAGPVDVVAVPGSRTLLRGAFAARLFHERGAALLVISGGHPSYAKGAEAQAISEAAGYAALARLSGVPAAALLLDHAARSTEHNGSGLAQLIRQAAERLGRPVHVLLTTSAFHSTRASLWLRRALREDASLASLGVEPSSAFEPLLLAFDDGGRGPRDKLAVVINEYLKIDFDLRREPLS